MMFFIAQYMTERSIVYVLDEIALTTVVLFSYFCI